MKMFEHRLGDAAGQQTWEALAMLVALRAWAPYWREERVLLEVTGDNIGVLHLVSSMRAGGAGCNKIAREIALDLADGVFRPRLCQHTPGTSNVIPDALSRKFQPGFQFVLPQELHLAVEISAPKRWPSYYKATAPPSYHQQ